MASQNFRGLVDVPLYLWFIFQWFCFHWGQNYKKLSFCTVKIYRGEIIFCAINKKSILRNKGNITIAAKVRAAIFQLLS